MTLKVLIRLLLILFFTLMVWILYFSFDCFTDLFSILMIGEGVRVFIDVESDIIALLFLNSEVIELAVIV